MARGERFDVRGPEGEEADGGVEATAIFRMERALELLFQVDEGPGDLDEPFVESGVRGGTPEPEVLEHIVSLIVFAGIKTIKICGVRDRQTPAGGAAAEDGLHLLMLGNARRPSSGGGNLSPGRIVLQAF